MNIIRSLISELRAVRGLFVTSVLVFLLATVMSQLAPFYLQAMIDGPLAALGKGKEASFEQMLQQAALYMGLVVLGGVLTYVANRSLIACGNRVAENLRNRAYDVLQNLPISYFDDKPAGKIATRIVNDTETLRQQFFGTLVQVFVNLVRIVFIYGILFYMNPLLACAMLLLIPVFYGVQVFYRHLTDQPMKDFYDARSQVNTQVNEVMNGSSLIQLYGQEEEVFAEFNETAQKMRAADNRIIWADSLASWTLTELVKNTVIALILAVVGFQYLGGSSWLTAGILFINLNYVINLFDMMGGLVRQLPNLQRSLETGKRVLELLGQEPELDSDALLEVTEGRVRFDHVTFAYEEGKPILKDIYFQAGVGETVALVGHTGSGKSSIMNLLYRFYDPQEGRILMDGQDIRDFSRESLRSHMGIVLQDPYLFTGTIASNVAMSQTAIDRERVMEALEKVGAHDLVARLDKGIDEPVLEKGAAFSSGERQLISFARTLYSDPKILILDEATSHIDTETEEVIQHAMEVVKEGRTTFIIAHRLSTIQHAEQILVLSQGQIVERGRHEELLAQGGLYAQMAQIQQEV